MEKKESVLGWERRARERERGRKREREREREIYREKELLAGSRTR